MFEVTLRECIDRVPALIEKAVEGRQQITAQVVRAVQERASGIREVLLIGSGTSNTAAVTAKYLMEEASGLPVRAVLPNDYLHGESVRRSDALAIAISQTGTSIMTQKCVTLAKSIGALTCAMSESDRTDIVQGADTFLDMGCGYEEHPTRTIGYSLTVLTLMLLGIELGRASGHLAKAQYDAYIADAGKLAADVRRTTEDAMAWLDRSRWQMLRSDALIYTGMNALQGVAMEATTKIWELPKIASFSYDLDECMHGPNYGMNSRHCLIVLDNGQVDSDRALALARYMKQEFHNGLVIGPQVVDNNDLKLELHCGAFAPLVYAAAIQIQAYRMAKDCGRDLQAPHDNHVMNSYFVSHTDYK